MNESFENALDIANNIGGEDYTLTCLMYYPNVHKFTATYSHKNGVSFLDVREAHYATLRAELETNWAESDSDE